MLIPSAVTTTHSSTPPPTPGLIDGFEAVPFTGLNGTWIPFSGTGADPTVTRTSSHVTQGSFSWEIQGITANINGGIITFGIDVTPINPSPTQFQIDVYAQSIGATDCVGLYVDDGTNFEEVDSAPGTTGAFTITVPVGSLSSFNSMTFQIITFGSLGSLSGNYDIYIDNLRAS